MGSGNFAVSYKTGRPEYLTSKISIQSYTTVIIAGSQKWSISSKPLVVEGFLNPKYPR